MTLDIIAAGLPESIVGEARIDGARAILTRLRDADRDPDSLHEENVALAVRVGTQLNRIKANESQVESGLRALAIANDQCELLERQLAAAEKAVVAVRELLRGAQPDIPHLQAVVAEAVAAGVASENGSDRGQDQPPSDG